MFARFLIFISIKVFSHSCSAYRPWRVGDKGEEAPGKLGLGQCGSFQTPEGSVGAPRESLVSPTTSISVISWPLKS